MKRNLTKMWHWNLPKVDYKAYIFLEPAYMIFSFAQGIADFADTNLFLQKSCRHNGTTEPDLSTPCDDERAGIEFVATINSRYTCPSSIITIGFTILLSAWSDKTGGKRKFCILVPMVLKSGQLVMMCFQSYFWHWPVNAAVVTSVILQASSGVRVGSVIYVCSITSPANRACRMTILHLLMTVSCITSCGSAGYLLRKLGFFYTYVFCSLLTLAAVIHVGLLVKNTAAKRTQGCIMCICDFVDTSYVVEAFRIVFKKRAGYERMIISLLSIINVLVWTAYIGEKSVLYLYLRYKFGWNELNYGPYIFYKLMGITVGSLICLAVHKLLHVSEGTIGTFAAFWDILAALGYFFAKEEWQLYLIPLLDIFHGFALTVCESMRSKFFKTQEFARLLSVHMTLNIGLSFTYPAYNFLFQKTMDSEPVSIFMLSVIINSLACILYGICNILIKKVPAVDQQINVPPEVL